MKIKLNQLSSFFFNHWLYSMIIFALGLLVYSVVLIIGIFPLISSVFSGVNSAYFLIALSGLLYCVYRLSGLLGSLSSFLVTLLLFALQLSAVWRSITSPSRYFLLGGLLPMSDASSYYQGARNLLEGNTLSVVASWRPIFSSTLAFVLSLTQQNLQIALAILVLINALASFLLAREVQQTHGTLAAVVSLSMIFLFYRYYIGTTMTENLGIALGTTGLAILWRGASQKAIYVSLFGIFVLTLALNTRAGAFFILPALIIWGMLSFGSSSRFSVHFLIVGISVIFLGFYLNSIIFKITGSTDATANGNFSYTFYGMVLSDFRNHISKLSKTHLAGLTQEFTGLGPNTTLTNTINLQNGNVIGMIADSALIPAQTGIVGACGKHKTNPDIIGPIVTGLSGYDELFYVDSMTLVSEPST